MKNIFGEEIGGSSDENTSGQSSNFSPTKTIGGYLWIDERQRKWVIPEGVFTKRIKSSTVIYDYDDIVNYELVEDGSSVAKGGTSIGRALVGGVLFGGAGAILGGATGKRKTSTICEKLYIKITVKKHSVSTAYINFISSATQKNGSLYQLCIAQAEEILSTLDILTKAKEKDAISYSSADEIRKYKELLDLGAITKTEYEKKKKQLLEI